MPEQEATTETQAIQADVDEARRELADTVEALSHKADVRGRSKEKAEQLRDRAKETATQVRDQARQLGGQARAEMPKNTLEARQQARQQARAAGQLARRRPKPVTGVALGVLGVAAVVLVRRWRRAVATRTGE